MPICLILGMNSGLDSMKAHAFKVVLCSITVVAWHSS
jgi:hypothetical protein